MSASTAPTTDADQPITIITDAYGPLPDLSSMTALNDFFDTNLPLFEKSAASAQASSDGNTQGQTLPSLSEHVKTLKAYVARNDTALLTNDELDAYAQLSVWHDKHAEALGGFYGKFDEARGVLSELERQAAADFIDSLPTWSSGYNHYEENTGPRLAVPLDLVNAAKTCLLGGTHISRQMIFMGNGTVRRQSSYDVAAIGPADPVASAPSDMCINHFATADEDLKRLYESQEQYMSVFDQYAATMFPITTLRESVRKTSQPGYSARFGDLYDFQPTIKERKQAVGSEWQRTGYSVQGHDDSVVLPIADSLLAAGQILPDPEYVPYSDPLDRY